MREIGRHLRIVLKEHNRSFACELLAGGTRGAG